MADFFLAGGLTESIVLTASSNFIGCSDSRFERSGIFLCFPLFPTAIDNPYKSSIFCVRGGGIEPPRAWRPVGFKDRCVYPFTNPASFYRGSGSPWFWTPWGSHFFFTLLASAPQVFVSHSFKLKIPRFTLNRSPAFAAR